MTSTTLSTPSNTVNSTCAPENPCKENVAAIFFLSVYILIALVGNSLVLLVFNWRWRSTGATKVYVLMLAGLDLLCTVLGTPRELWAAACWCIDLSYCRFTVFSTYHLNFTSDLVLTAIAVSRLVKVTEQGHAPSNQAKVRGHWKVKVAVLKGAVVKVARATNTIRGAKLVCVLSVFLSFIPTWPIVIESWHDVKTSDECRQDESKTLACSGTMQLWFYLFHTIVFIVFTTILVCLYSAVVLHVRTKMKEDRSGRFSAKSSVRLHSMDQKQRASRGFLKSDHESDSGNAQQIRSCSKNAPLRRSASDITKCLRADSDQSGRFDSNFDTRNLRSDLGDSRFQGSKSKDCRSPICSESEFCRTPFSSETEDCRQMRSAFKDSRIFHAEFGNFWMSTTSGSRFSREASRRSKDALSDTAFKSPPEEPIKSNKRMSVRMSDALSDNVFECFSEAPIKNSKRLSVSSDALDVQSPEQEGFQSFQRLRLCRSLSDTVTRRNKRNSKTFSSEERKFSNFPPISYSEQLISSFNLTSSGEYDCSDGGLFRRTSTSSFQITKHGNRAKQTTLVFLFITIIYIVSYLPYYAITLANKSNVALDKTLSDVFLRSHLLSNVLNPLVYGFCNPYFRSTVWKILTRRRVII